MIKTVLCVLAILSLVGCTPPSPEQLAKESCDCFQEARSNKNADNAIAASEKCGSIVQTNMRRMREIEQEQDMNDEQVKIFEERFTDTYNKCK